MRATLRVMARRKKEVLSGIVLLLILTAVASGAFFIAEYTLTHESFQNQIASFGYLGITFLAMVAGLNVIVPIPAATFTPVFTAAGLALPLIVLSLTIGTLLADFIGYAFGKLSRETVATKYPGLVAKLEHLYEHRRTWLLPVVFLYASFVPIPNEALVIPLAFLGIRWRLLVIPLFLGNLINQAIYAYGFQNLYHYFF